jgi:HAD superfamily hydrolase (TIGR01549 family)
MSHSIETLFLDAGGVIVHPAWDRVSQALATEGIKVTADALRTAEAPAKRDIDHAQTIQQTTDAARGWLYFNKVLGHAGIPLSDATDAALAVLREYHRNDNLWEEVTPGVQRILAALRTRVPKLVVVSNANGRLRHLFDRLGLTQYFDVVLDSHEWGVEKPDPRLFQIALEESASMAEHTVHVGDLYYIDVVGARAAGLREGILLDTAGLYPDVDCRRIRRLDELPELLNP